jgi:glycosyltransferase involved in cell wall biosynthesis
MCEFGEPRKPVKVLYFLNRFPVVSETFVRNEIEWAERQGYLYGVAALNVDEDRLPTVSGPVRRKIRGRCQRYIGRSKQPFVAAHWLLRAPIRFISVWRGLPSDPTFRQYFWRAAACGASFARIRPDVIHAHFANEAAQSARYLSLLTGASFTLCTHRYDIFDRPPPNYPQLANAAACMVTISEYNRRYLTQYHGVPETKIHVVHCGVDIQRFCRKSPRPEMSARPLRLLNTGRLEHVKGQRYLIDACAILADRGVDFSLDILGEGDLRGELQQQIDHLGLQERVHLRGAAQPAEVAAALEQAHVFVLPSLSEGISVAAMEAMAMELPVIATRVNGMPELIEHEVSGLLVEPADSGQLAEAIDRYANDADFALRAGRGAREKIRSEFNADTEHEKLAALWLRTIKPSRAKGQAALLSSQLSD